MFTNTQNLNNEGIPKSEIVKYTPDYESVRKTLYYHKNNQYEPYKTTEDIDHQTMIDIKNAYNERYCLYDLIIPQRMMCFSADWQLQLLAIAEFWYADGTFASSPKGWKQVYSIHAYINNQMFPCAHIILKNKSEESYTTMINELNSNASKHNIQLKPKRICCDYEKAAIASFEKAYSCEFRGCLFHYTQCLLKHIKACKLFVHYKDQENKTVHKWFQLFISLPFLPVHLVEFGFNYIIENKPQVPNFETHFDNFISYFKYQWFQNFPPHTWNHYQSSLPRTTNRVESRNEPLHKAVGTNSSIHSFIHGLQRQENKWHMDYDKMNECGREVPRRSIDTNRDLRIFELTNELNQNLHDKSAIINFMKMIKYSYMIDPEFEYNQPTADTQPKVLPDPQPPKPKSLVKSFILPPVTLPLTPSLDLSHLINKQEKTFRVIKLIFETYRPQLIELISFFRTCEYLFICNNLLLKDEENHHFVSTKLVNCMVVQTLGDGNCLYNSISMSIFGNNSMSLNIKLASVFILLEYDQYFKQILNKTGAPYTYEKLVQNTARMDIWGNQFIRTAISIIFNRPVWCLSPNNDYFTNPNHSFKLPIIINWNGINHYSAIMPINPNFTCLRPAFNQENNMPVFSNFIDYIKIDSLYFSITNSNFISDLGDSTNAITIAESTDNDLNSSTGEPIFIELLSSSPSPSPSVIESISPQSPATKKVVDIFSKFKQIYETKASIVDSEPIKKRRFSWLSSDSEEEEPQPKKKKRTYYNQFRKT